MARVLEIYINLLTPPMHNNRRIKLRYAHAGGRNPPLIVIHGKQTDKLPDSYVKYLEKNFRKYLKLEGTPIRIELRSDVNPYTKGEAELNNQQIARKRRLKKNREYLKAK
jgi:GTPase